MKIRNKIIRELHEAASKKETEAIKLKEINLHQMHKEMEFARALRIAANFLDGVQAS